METNTLFTNPPQNISLSEQTRLDQPKSSDEIKCKYCTYNYAKKIVVERRNKVVCFQCQSEYYLCEQHI